MTLTIHATYKVWDDQLQGRCHEKRKHSNNTWLERKGEAIVMTLHATDIVTVVPSGQITLNSGGWQTPTTKSRINDALHELGVRFAGVSQAKHVWYFCGWHYVDGACRDHTRVPYHDGMQIRADEQQSAVVVSPPYKPKV